MATAVSARPIFNGPKIKRPNPPPLHVPLKGVSSSLSFSSPSLSSKRPPPISTFSNTSSAGAGANGTTTRTSTRRKDSQRPSQPRNNSRGLVLDVTNDTHGAVQKQLTEEPYVRTTEYLLKKFKGKPPSLILHLHPTHFRFDQQDGSFGYNSPMKIILEHLRAQTVPHDMLEELLTGNVPFYDGCLIVEVHDHKSGSGTTRNLSSLAIDADNIVPFSIHNYNEHITPSPYVAYPIPKNTLFRPNNKEEHTNSMQMGTEEETTAREDPLKSCKDNLAAKPRVFTTVLHPTSQSRYRELSILAGTSIQDNVRTAARRQVSTSVRDAGTPITAHPATPLSSMSPTLKTPKTSLVKSSRMTLQENDFHGFEASLLTSTEGPLFLEPAQSFEDAQAIMHSLVHPLHLQLPAQPKGRKRTIAELAADEAQAAEDEQISLSMDTRLKPSLAVAAGASVDGQASSKDFQPTFTMFKRLEDIRREFTERARRESEERAQREIVKRHQQEQEELQKRNFAEQNNRQERARQLERYQQSQLTHPQKRVGQILPQINPAQQAMINQGSSGALVSPISRNHTPTVSSPSIQNGMTNHHGTVVSIAPSASKQSPGSPPRTGSAVQMSMGVASLPMGRQTSQQLSQSGQTRTGTPLNPQATPQLDSGIANRHITPQQAVNQGAAGQLGIQVGPQGNLPSGLGLAVSNGSQLNGMPLNAQQATMLAQRRAQTARAHHAAQIQGSPHVQQMSTDQRNSMQAHMAVQNQRNTPGASSMMTRIPNMPNQGVTPQQQQYQVEMRRAMAMHAANQSHQQQMANFQPGSSGLGMPNTPAISAIVMSPNASLQAHPMQSQDSQQPQQQQQHQLYSQGLQNRLQPGQHPQPGRIPNQMINLTPEQQAHFAAQKQRQMQQHQQEYLRFCQQFLAPHHNGQIPANAHTLYIRWKKEQMHRQQMLQQQQQQQQQMQSGGQAVNGGPINQIYSQQLQLNQQRLLFQQQQQRLMGQVAGQQQMGRGMNGGVPQLSGSVVEDQSMMNSMQPGLGRGAG